MRPFLASLCCLSTLAVAGFAHAAPTSLNVQVDGLTDGAPVTLSLYRLRAAPPEDAPPPDEHLP